MLNHLHSDWHKSQRLIYCVRNVSCSCCIYMYAFIINCIFYRINNFAFLKKNVWSVIGYIFWKNFIFQSLDRAIVKTGVYVNFLFFIYRVPESMKILENLADLTGENILLELTPSCPRNSYEIRSFTVEWAWRSHI